MNSSSAALLCLLALMACSKPETAPPLVKELTGAAITPLNDLNLVHDKIPPVLIAAQHGPYAPPSNPTCEGLKAEIHLLDAALGADLDVPGHPDERHLLEKGKDAAERAAVNHVRSAAESLIPYRGWVRKLSGAEKFSQQVTRAIGAGIVRRAYLKGLGQAQGCSAPAAPMGAEAKPATSMAAGLGQAPLTH